MIVGVSMVKDEQDVIDDTVNHMCRACDFVVVADNNSTDETGRILRDIEVRHGNLMVIDDKEVGYYQSRKMSALARFAISRWGKPGDWVVPFDADELWLGVERLNYQPFELTAVVVPGFDYKPTIVDDWGLPYYRAMAFRSGDPTSFQPKVAFRWFDGALIDQGNHAISFEGRRPATVALPGLGIAHYPIRTFRQFCSKAKNGGAAYAATDLDPNLGNHWRRWGNMERRELIDEFAKHFSTNPLAELIEDPAVQVT